MGNQPAKKFVVGNVDVSVWQNTLQKDGQDFIKSSVTLQKTYKKGNEFAHTGSLDVNEIPKAIVALQQAYEFLLTKQE